jgi:1-acyl-sn-glycerol-3-phosphate acyltransferase
VNFRFLLGFPLVVAWMVGVGIPGLFVGAFDSKGGVLLAITRGWARLILLCAGVRVEVEGREHAPDGPAVYAANHVSALDIPLLFAHLPVRFRIIHKRSLYWTPVVGQYLYFGGHIDVDRKNAFRAKRSLKRAADRIRGGVSVAVFPEGSRSPDGRLQPFKRGTFVLAQDAGVPVVPVSLLGVKDVVPAGLVSVRPGRIVLRLHPAVSTEGRDAEAIADEVRQVIARDFQESAA